MRWWHEETPLPMRPDLHGEPSLEAVAMSWLEQVARWLPARGYYLYWRSDDGRQLQLRASLDTRRETHIEPHYSGLALEEFPIVPLALPTHLQAHTVSLSGPANERWLALPFGGIIQVQVLLHPNQAVPARLRRRLAAACRLYEPLAQATANWLAARPDNPPVYSLERYEWHEEAADSIPPLLRWGGQLLGAAVGCAVLHPYGEPEVLADTPPGQELGEIVSAGHVPALVALSAGPDLIPGAQLGRIAQGFAACVRVPGIHDGQPLGCFYYLVDGLTELTAHQAAALRLLGERAALILAGRRLQAAARANYAAAIRAVTTAAEAARGSGAVGRADRLARYARLIATELRLSAAEIEAVALAAYCADLSLALGVSSAQVASLLRPLQSRYDLAAIIAAVHERWDGSGQPAGLTGDAIPLGARIVAAALLFEEHTAGSSEAGDGATADGVNAAGDHAAAANLADDRRSSSRSFPDAIAALEAAAGNELDPAVVKAFLSALSRGRQRALPGRPLTRCWELKQVPAAVCHGCANRVENVIACWENPQHMCRRHGDTCETCVVYTEAMSRPSDGRLAELWPFRAGGEVASS